MNRIAYAALAIALVSASPAEVRAAPNLGATTAAQTTVSTPAPAPAPAVKAKTKVRVPGIEGVVQKSVEGTGPETRIVWWLVTAAGTKHELSGGKKVLAKLAASEGKSITAWGKESTEKDGSKVLKVKRFQLAAAIQAAPATAK